MAIRITGLPGGIFKPAVNDCVIACPGTAYERAKLARIVAACLRNSKEICENLVISPARAVNLMPLRASSLSLAHLLQARYAAMMANPAMLPPMDRALVIYSFDDVSVDLHSHRLIRAGSEVALEPKAFAVLTLLLEHPGELLNRERLLDAVWGHSYVAPATLNRIITVLRRALGDDSAAPRYIETVHGLGYRFAVTPTRAQRSLDNNASMPAQPEDAKSIAIPPRLIGTSNKYRLVIGSLLFVLIAAIIFAALQARNAHRRESPPAAKPPGIAVLPFSARDGDADLRATAEGLSESLTDAFARSASLRVAGRESLLALGRGQANPQHVVEVLDVDYVLVARSFPRVHPYSRTSSCGIAAKRHRFGSTSRNRRASNCSASWCR